jgi:glycerol-3-phosphate O-acyltransferase/dihydroxyacetone phosphate acyltransferase
VTITAPDYATLELFWMMRRLYMQKMVEETGKRPTLAQQVALTKAFSGGWAHIATKPGVPELMEMVASYNQQLRLYGMKDYHVEANTRINNITLLRAFFLSMRMLFNGAVALPGLLLGLPLLAMTRYFSENERVKALKTSTVKITGRDVLATYKVLISLVFTPVLHVAYTAVVWRLISERTAVIYMFFSPFVCWGAVRCAESSKLAYREAWAILSLMLKPTNLTQLRAQRKAIKEGVLDLFTALPADKQRGALDDASKAEEVGEPPEQWLELCEKLRANSLRLRRTGSFVSLDN